jgi:IclR family transcriptional regulator, pca regulon regulatory protein
MLESQGPGRSNPLFVNSVAKCMAVLRAFAGAGRFLSLLEIANRADLDKSAAQRMVHTLHQLGYLEKCPETRRYALGSALLDFSFQFIRTHPLVEVATPHLIELRRACDERVDMSLFDGDTLVYVIRLQSRHAKYFTTVVGRRMPVFCTAGGRAMLANLPRDEALRIIGDSPREPRTRHTITDVAAIMAKIDQARGDGYSVAVEEAVAGEITMGAAIVDGAGAPLGAIHIAAATANWTPEAFVEHMLPKLRETLRALNPRGF